MQHAAPSPGRRTGSRLARLDDERLAALVCRGDAAAFETLYDRHHAALLAFCRHMLGDRQDGEDALQQAFLRAHRALAEGRAPDRVRPWLFAIARNRCLTLLAARRDAAVPAAQFEPSYEGLSSDVERRADLRELLSDLARLPDDQRGALVLAELGDFSHPEIARVIGCPTAKVKALIFQARTALIADRDARSTPCKEIRALLETARGGVLRRGSLRRHLRQCDPCATYRVAIEGRRSGLAIVLPVAPTAGLKAAVLGGLGGGAEPAAAVAALAAPGSLGVSSAGGVAAKALVAKAALVVAVGAGAVGGAAAVHEPAPPAPVRANPVERVADRPAPVATRVAERPPTTTDEAESSQPPGASQPVAAPVVPTVQPPERRRLRRAALRRLLASAPPAVRHRIRRRLARARARRAERVGEVIGTAPPLLGRRRRDPQPDPDPTPTATPSPTATPEPAATPRPHRRRRHPPVATPTPTPTSTAEPATTPAVTPAPEPTSTPTSTP
jgi:RNA polymerase sigma factor (sigma-70 family)